MSHLQQPTAPNLEDAMPHREDYKTIRHYHEPGDVHEFTFSCFHQFQLLTNNAWRTNLSRAIDDASGECSLKLAAFVYMPEHVHLLLWTELAEPDLSLFLALVKRPVSAAAKKDLIKSNSRLLERLTVQERPGKTVFRFWQEGPGFDRNLQSPETVQFSMDYLHNNPVKRGLVQKATDWRWSSARFYASEGAAEDELLPRLTPLPAEYWSMMKKLH